MSYNNTINRNRIIEIKSPLKSLDSNNYWDIMKLKNENNSLKDEIIKRNELITDLKIKIFNNEKEKKEINIKNKEKEENMKEIKEKIINTNKKLKKIKENMKLNENEDTKNKSIIINLNNKITDLELKLKTNSNKKYSLTKNRRKQSFNEIFL